MMLLGTRKSELDDIWLYTMFPQSICVGWDSQEYLCHHHVTSGSYCEMLQTYVVPDSIVTFPDINQPDRIGSTIQSEKDLELEWLEDFTTHSD